MHARTLSSALFASIAVLAGAALLGPALAQDTAPSVNAAASSDALTIPQVLEKLEAAGYRDFTEVERERDRFEVKAIDSDGRRVEVYVDAVSGEVVKTEVERSK